MNRTPWIRRLIAAVAAASLAFSAFAISLPQGARLRIVDEQGSVVGVGKVEDGRELEIDLLRGQAGFATLTVRLPDGAEETYEIRYNDQGEILVVVDGEVRPLQDLAREAGLEFDFSFEDRDDLDRRGDNRFDDWDDDDWDDDDRWDDDWDDDDDRFDDRDDDRDDRDDRDDDNDDD